MAVLHKGWLDLALGGGDFLTKWTVLDNGVLWVHRDDVCSCAAEQVIPLHDAEFAEECFSSKDPVNTVNVKLGASGPELHIRAGSEQEYLQWIAAMLASAQLWHARRQMALRVVLPAAAAEESSSRHRAALSGPAEGRLLLVQGLGELLEHTAELRTRTRRAVTHCHCDADLPRFLRRAAASAVDKIWRVSSRARSLAAGAASSAPLAVYDALLLLREALNNFVTYCSLLRDLEVMLGGGGPLPFVPLRCLASLRDDLARLGPLVQGTAEEAVRQRTALAALDTTLQRCWRELSEHRLELEKELLERAGDRSAASSPCPGHSSPEPDPASLVGSVLTLELPKPKGGTCRVRRLASCLQRDVVRLSVRRARKRARTEGLALLESLEMTALPVAPPVESPVASPVAPPVASPVESPVASPVAPPVESPVASPVASSVDSPVASSVASPLESTSASPSPSLCAADCKSDLEDDEVSECVGDTASASSLEQKHLQQQHLQQQQQQLQHLQHLQEKTPKAPRRRWLDSALLLRRRQVCSAPLGQDADEDLSDDHLEVASTCSGQDFGESQAEGRTASPGMAYSGLEEAHEPLQVADGQLARDALDIPVTPATPNGGGRRALWCETAEVQRSGLLDRLNTTESALQEAKFEVLSSEESYLRALDVLAHRVQSIEALQDPTVTADSERDAVLQFLDAARACSLRFVSVLRAAWSLDMMLRGLCTLMHKEASAGASLPQYVHIVSLQPRAASVLLKIGSLEASQLVPLLSLPAQRASRLPLLLAAILRRLDQRTSEAVICRAALDRLNQIVFECNEALRRAEHSERIAEIGRILLYEKSPTKKKSWHDRKNSLFGRTKSFFLKSHIHIGTRTNKVLTSTSSMLHLS